MTNINLPSALSLPASPISPLPQSRSPLTHLLTSPHFSPLLTLIILASELLIFAENTYSAQVVVSVVTNLPLLNQYLTTMQEMTSSICSSIPEGVEGQLEDTRDGQLYWVGKMKDGKCWMLQNLALGNTTGTMNLTPSDSNVSSNWTLPRAYTSAKDGDGSQSNPDVVQLWNFGKWVLATPLLTKSCSSTGISSIVSCIKVGFVNVSDGSKFEPTYTTTTSKWEGANTTTEDTLVAVNCTSWSGSGTSKICTAGTYDARYLVGNYYSWGAATAASGDGITNGNANSSICPKGWKLPTSNTTSVGSFAGLLSKYGVSSNLSSTVSGTTYNIAGKPLRFVRSGVVSPGNGVSSAGQHSRYWSSRADSSNSNAYNLYFNNSSVDSSGSNLRYLGFSVRCIAE